MGPHPEPQCMEEEGVCPAGGAIDDNIVLTIRNVKKARRDPAG